MAITLSHGGTTIYSSDKQSSEVLVGTKEGVVILERAGAGWRVAHRSLENSHISAIIIEPDSGLVFAGAYHDGIYASSDGGRTWERRDNGVTEKDVYSLASAKVNGRTRVFAGTEPAHLFYSDDLGKNWGEFPKVRSVNTVEKWSFPAPPHIAHLKHINFAPGDPTTIFASIEVGGLLKSTDGGQTWVDLPGVYEDVHRTVIDPRDGNSVYVTGGMGLWHTTDCGKTWENTATKEAPIGGYPDQLVYVPSNPDIMFIAAAQKSPNAWRTEHTARSRVSRSLDGGRTWEVLAGGLVDLAQPSVEAMAVEEAGGKVSLFTANTAGEVWFSEDGGVSWSAIATGLAPISKGGHYRPLVEAAVS